MTEKFHIPNNFTQFTTKLNYRTYLLQASYPFLVDWTPSVVNYPFVDYFPSLMILACWSPLVLPVAPYSRLLPVVVEEEEYPYNLPCTGSRIPLIPMESSKKITRVYNQLPGEIFQAFYSTHVVVC